jgi:hypothetical protein
MGRRALLGHGIVAVERWRVGEVDHHRIFRGCLRGEATKERGAHIHTCRDEFCCGSRQWREQLMRRLQEVGYPRRGQGRGAATRVKLALTLPAKRTREYGAYFGQLVGRSALASMATTTSMPRALTKCCPRGTFSLFEPPSMSSSHREFKSWKLAFPERL